MSPDPIVDATQAAAAISRRERTAPRPGHADLAGALKYLTTDLRNIIERSSARDTAARVAAGMLVQSVLDVFGVEVRSHVVGIEAAFIDRDVTFDEMDGASASDVACVDERIARRMRAAIDAAKKDGDTLGGEIEIAVVRWSYSRISAFNPNSLSVHGRMGACKLFSATFLCIGQVQITVARTKPYLHLGLSKNSRPKLTLSPSA